MKTSPISLIIFILISGCLSSTPEPAHVGQEDIVESDTTTDFYRDNYTEIRSSDTIGKKPLIIYLNDESIPISIRELFNYGKNPPNDEAHFAILDSLYSKDKERISFYFLVVTRVFWWADGAFAENLGYRAKEYVEQNPYDFSLFFTTEKVLKEQDLNNWADAIAMEIGISDEDNIKSEVDNVANKLREGCLDCSIEQQKVIEQFVTKLREYSNYN